MLLTNDNEITRSQDCRHGNEASHNQDKVTQPTNSVMPAEVNNLEISRKKYHLTVSL